MTETRRRRRWFSLRLQTFLVLIVILAVGLGWWVNGARQQQAIVAMIKSRDAYSITYDDGVEVDCAYNRGLLSPSETPPKATPWWPIASFERSLGRDFFHSVVGVMLGGDHIYSPPLTHKDVIPLVAKLPRLRSLSLPSLGELTDEDLRQITRLTSLEYLHLDTDGTELTDEGLRSLGKMTNLKTLEVWGDFTDDGLVALNGLVRLEELRILVTSSRLVGPPPPRLVGRGFIHLANLPRLRSLEVESGVINGDGLEALGTLKLEELNIIYGAYADEDLKHLAHLNRLKSLGLFNSPIQGDGLRFLDGLPQLSSLWLCYCRNLVDPAIPYVARLPALQTLELTRSKVTVAGLEQLRLAPRLKAARLSLPKPGDKAQLQQALPGVAIRGL